MSLAVSSLAASAGVGQVVLTWVQGVDPCLPYLRLSVVEVWEAAVNDRDQAALVGEAKGNAFVRNGLTPGVQRWYWVRPRDASDEAGAWHPEAADAGVSATPLKVTNADLEDGAVDARVLQPGTVEYESFVAGIEPVGLSVGLPNPSGYTGPRVLFNTSDRKLYRLDGGAWTAAVPTSDLTGYIGADQIAVNSLSAISADLGMITAGTLSAAVSYLGYIEAEQINVGTLTGFTVRTSSGSSRVEMTGSNNQLRVYYQGSHVGTVGMGASLGRIFWGSNNSGFLPTAEFENASGAAVEARSGGSWAIWAESDGAISGAVFAEAQSSSAPAIDGVGQWVGVRGTGITSAGVIGDGPTFDFYAVGSGAYGPFTGAHDAMLPHDEEANLEPGDIVYDAVIIARGGMSSTLAEVRRTTAPREARASGVFTGRVTSLTPNTAPSCLIMEDGEEKVWRRPEYADLKDRYGHTAINALGDGVINVCGENGDIAPGDWITSSSRPGKGMRQSDDVYHSYTVAKAREAAVFTSPDEVKQIACYYAFG